MNVKWLFGKKKPAETPAIPKEIPTGDDRRGPVPPPPRTAHAPGVTVFSFDAIPSQNLLRLDEGYGGFFLEGEEGTGGAAALLVLEGGGELKAGRGDVLIWAADALAPSTPPAPSSRATLWHAPWHRGIPRFLTTASSLRSPTWGRRRRSNVL